MISVHFQGNLFNITVIQVYALTSNAEETEVEPFYENLQDHLELTPEKDVLFIIGGWDAKVESQETPGKGKGICLENLPPRQIWPWRTERSRTKANRVLLGGHRGHSKHPLSTTKDKTLHRDITRWSTLKSD